MIYIKRNFPNLVRVGPGQEAQTLVKMIASKLGQRSIAAKFYSKELNDVDGYLVLNVSDNSTEDEEGEEEEEEEEEEAEEEEEE